MYIRTHHKIVTPHSEKSIFCSVLSSIFVRAIPEKNVWGDRPEPFFLPPPPRHQIEINDVTPSSQIEIGYADAPN